MGLEYSNKDMAGRELKTPGPLGLAQNVQTSWFFKSLSWRPKNYNQDFDVPEKIIRY